MKKSEISKSKATAGKPRRDFLGKSVGAIAGLTLGSGLLSTDALSQVAGGAAGVSSVAALNEALILLPDGKLYNEAALYEKLGLAEGRNCNKTGCTFCIIHGNSCSPFSVPLKKGTLVTGGGREQPITECKRVMVALKPADAEALVAKGILDRPALENIRKHQ
jgi:hypothetical protein